MKRLNWNRERTENVNYGCLYNGRHYYIKNFGNDCYFQYEVTVRGTGRQNALPNSFNNFRSLKEAKAFAEEWAAGFDLFEESKKLA